MTPNPLRWLKAAILNRPTSVDQAVSTFTQVVEDLEYVADLKRDRVSECAAEIEELKRAKADAENEAARAEKLRQHMEKMLNV